MGGVMRWLQIVGLCPYVVVGSDGACRVSWLLAAWCVVYLALSVALQVWVNVENAASVRVVDSYQRSVLAIGGRILLDNGTQVAFSVTRLLLLLLSPCLPPLVREVTALKRLTRGLNPTGPHRLSVTSLVYLWICVLQYLFFIIRLIQFIVANLCDLDWLVFVLSLGDWLLSFLCFPVVVLLFSLELRRLQAATRAVLPPRWKHLVTEVRDEATGIHSTMPWGVPTATATPDLAPFMRRARVLLQQTEEVHGDVNANAVTIVRWPTSDNVRALKVTLNSAKILPLVN